MPPGHSRREQSASLYPLSLADGRPGDRVGAERRGSARFGAYQAHTEEMQMPCPLQLFGHGSASAIAAHASSTHAAIGAARVISLSPLSAM